MRLGILFTALASAALPVQAGLIFTVSATSMQTTDAGMHVGGALLSISVSGTVNLDGASGQITINPDGSMVTQSAPSSPQDYTYFLQGHPYPQVAGGNGINNFPGGGANYDSFSNTPLLNPSPWAPEGPMTTDTSDPAALRFGSLVGTFNPSPTPTDWFLVGRPQPGGGYGGTFITPAGGATLMLAIPDTNYTNNFGAFTVTLDELPEPAAIWLAFSGFAALGLPRALRRLSRKQ